MHQYKKRIEKVFAIFLSLILILSLCSPSIAVVSAIENEDLVKEEILSDNNGNETSTSQDTITIENLNQNMMLTTMSISQEQKLSQMIEKTVDYYRTETKLTSWQSIVALWGAGEDLSKWQLPDWKTKDPGLKATAGGTDHIRYIFGLLAMGEDPSNAWETKRNLYEELAEQQKEDGSIGGINKHLYAMLALKTGEKLEHFSWDDAKEQKALEYLLKQEISGGGFALSGTHPDTDITGMVLLTLGMYQDESAVQDVIKRAKAVLKQKQLDNAGFNSDGQWGSSDNTNSLAVAVSGLVAVGENLETDEWTREQTVIDTFERFQLDNGSFKWKATDTNMNGAATEQALIALLDIQHKQTTWHRFAEELPKKVSVSITVDGIDGNILPKNIIEIKAGQTTALQVLKQALGNEIEFVIEETSFGPYVKSIGGLEAGSLGGWDGWMYTVNGEALEVGANDYQVKNGDHIRFYYSRWADISTDATINSNSENPTLSIVLKGDRFTNEATNVGNWVLDYGKTGLQVKSIHKESEQQVTLQFEGTAKGGTISIQALADALEGESASNKVSVKVVQKITSNNQKVSIKADENEDTVILEFSQQELPEIEAENGNTLLSIPQGTKVETENWDQLLEISKGLEISDSEIINKINAKLTDKKAEKLTARIKIGGDKEIRFNQHVTFTFKGMGDKEAGFIDHNGEFEPIPKVTENVNPQPDVYAYAAGSDLIIKTKHFTEFLAYQATIKDEPEQPKEQPGNGSDNGNSGGGGSSKEQVVTISIDATTAGKGYFLKETKVKLEKGDTVFDILQRVAKDHGISIEYTGSGKTVYVQKINNLGEFDEGPLSGWMYSVNGKFPDVSAGAYIVKAGDKIHWRYTTDLGKDVGNEYKPEDDKNQTGSSGGGGGGGSTKSKKNVDTTALQNNIQSSSDWILKNVNFKVYDGFNDWSAFALQRAGKTVPTDYYKTLKSYVKEQNGEFKLVTDYERIVLAVTAIGKDPRNIAGYNFIEKIYQNERMTNQGTNGVIFALLALDAKNYEVPKDALWTREKLIDWLLEQQNSDGGFSLSKSSNSSSDIDITAMALQALSNYQSNPKVKEATSKALSWLSKQQLENGGFKSYGVENSESISQVIITLTSLGIDLNDSRFVKKKGDLLSALTSFVNEDGGIAHARKESSNSIATQQGLMAFAAYERLINNQNSLYNMKDENKTTNNNTNNETNKPTNKITFSDINDTSFGKDEIYQLVEAGIINGYPDGTFRPNQNLNRGQAANLLMRALKLEVPETTHPFGDVDQTSPYFDGAIATKAAGIFNGKNNGDTFGALDTLTREQMASILVRAFNLQPKEDVPVNLTDLDRVSETHRKNVEILYQNGITTGRANGEFDPHSPVTRAQFVVFLSRALKLTNN